jgi:hypothetical protein
MAKAKRRVATRRPTSKSGSDRAALLVGTWAPGDETESNVHFTVARRGRGLAVIAVDIYDGEKLRVSGVAWDGKALRFETATPSTGAGMAHELRPVSAARAVYRFTITQSWKKLEIDRESDRAAGRGATRA